MSGLTLRCAQNLCATALAEARALGAKISCAVVDSGGNLMAFARDDGAEIAGPVLAVDKAYTAVANRIATDELALLAAPGQPLYGIHATAQGRFVVFGGGIPLTLSDEVVGAIGVSGGTVDQDVRCARAAAQEFPTLTQDQGVGHAHV
ncbi:heme-binding protein [Streptomyces sp. NPDC014864]|uniref:GlcG/HbpS family heme-binding protein n=1 Tax=Streptomyces sp. NPDC014864 TaxID=3364924 RepID=UPI0036F53ED9